MLSQYMQFSQMNSLKGLQTIGEDNKGNYHGWKRDEKIYIYIHISEPAGHG